MGYIERIQTVSMFRPHSLGTVIGKLADQLHCCTFLANTKCKPLLDLASMFQQGSHCMSQKEAKIFSQHYRAGM
jgi:hypothetical protein